jgi:hypothetical protein
MATRVKLQKKKHTKQNRISGREPKGAWRQELTGGKPQVVK